VVQLRSIDNNLNDGNPGAADFGNDSAQSWDIALGSSVTNFAAGKFSVDDSAFQNDLAGGYFVVTSNSNSLLLSFVPNHSPSANDVTFYLPRSGILQIPLTMLAAQWSDPDGDPVQFAGTGSSSVNGLNNVGSDGSFIYYTNSTGMADEVIYVIADVRTNPPAVYRPGDTQRTATGVIHILPPPAISGVTMNGGNLIFSGTNGAHNGTYYVLTSTDLTLPMNLWTVIATNTFDSHGNFNFTNPVDGKSPQQFYMLEFP